MPHHCRLTYNDHYCRRPELPKRGVGRVFVCARKTPIPRSSGFLVLLKLYANVFFFRFLYLGSLRFTLTAVFCIRPFQLYKVPTGYTVQFSSRSPCEHVPFPPKVFIPSAAVPNQIRFGFILFSQISCSDAPCATETAGNFIPSSLWL